jgi:hypothetical protein
MRQLDVSSSRRGSVQRMSAAAPFPPRCTIASPTHSSSEISGSMPLAKSGTLVPFLASLYV